MDTMPNNTMREVKLCLFGDAGVGKSCLAYRFVNDRFDLKSIATIGAAFMTKSFKANDCCFKYNIWDTAGQERYHTLAPMYYRGAAAAIIVYDITSELTFESIQRWVKEIQRGGPEDIVIAIAGNKKDLADKREVSTENGQIYANEIGALFFECSALTGKNVDELFTEISQRLPSNVPEPPHQGFPKKRITDTKKKCCIGP